MWKSNLQGICKECRNINALFAISFLTPNSIPLKIINLIQRISENLQHLNFARNLQRMSECTFHHDFLTPNFNILLRVKRNQFYSKNIWKFVKFEFARNLQKNIGKLLHYSCEIKRWKINLQGFAKECRESNVFSRKKICNDFYSTKKFVYIPKNLPN